MLWVLIGMTFLGMVLFLPDIGFTQSTYEIEDDLSVDEADSLEDDVVSLDFKDANLKDVLKVFSQQSGLNFVATQEIQDLPITLYMENVKVEDALQTLLSSSNLGLSQSSGSNIMIVQSKPAPPLKTRTKVYKLRYFHASASPGQYMMGEVSGGGGGSGMDWSNIIQPLMSQFGTVISYVNLLVVTDVPDRFKLIDQVISEIDRPIPEVMMEVELIETTADFLKAVGVKWSGELARYAGPQRITPMPYNMFNGNRADPGETRLTLLEKDGARFQYGLLSSTGLTFLMQMLESDNNTKFLAKPRILCQDREWAEIKITSDAVVSVKTTVTEGTGGVTRQSEVERMEIGTILRLVPMINEAEGFVSILLEPSISRATNSTFTDENATPFIDPQSRSLRTVVMIGDGDTVAVGGFITTEDEEVLTKIPWLGDIPMFGMFFRSKETQRIDKELLIFITPKIILPTERMHMWVDSKSEQIVGATPVEEKKIVEKPAKSEQNDEIVGKMQSVAAKKLPFREQDDLKLDLTVKSSSLGGVNLVK